MGADLRRWFLAMPRVHRAPLPLADLAAAVATSRPAAGGGAAAAGSCAAGGGIRRHLHCEHCLLCGRLAPGPLCATCAARPQEAAAGLQRRRGVTERALHRLLLVCAHCAGWADGGRACVSTDCPALYERARAREEWERGELVDWGIGQLTEPVAPG